MLNGPGRRAADAGQGWEEAVSPQPSRSRKGEGSRSPLQLLLPSPSFSKALPRVDIIHLVRYISVPPFLPDPVKGALHAAA